MLLPTYINVNRGGIPAISSLSVNVTTTMGPAVKVDTASVGIK